MKVESYQRVIEKRVVDVKQYILKISEEYCQDSINDILDECFDIRTIKKRINQKKDLQLFIFSKIKQLIDDSKSFNEIEQHLIFMNILLDKYYQPLVVYKHKLLNYIIDKAGFCITTYCLLRHLIKYNERKLEAFIEALANQLNLGIERYHYLASYILLLEGRYKSAYLHLEYVTIDEFLECFIPELYNYSPRLYKKYCKKMRMTLDVVTM